MRKYICFLLLIFFVGCSLNTTPKKSTSFQTIILSPMIKINDIGFLHEKKNELNLQIYNSAVNVANVKIGKNICINSVCFSKSQFNLRFFKSSHYNDILRDILLKNPIYDGLNLTKTSCGFNQHLKDNLIQYEVCGNDVKFFDTQNRIKIIIKEIR